MGIGEGAEKSVGATHVCVGNHDNPSRGRGGERSSGKYLPSKGWTGRDETQEMQATRFKRERSIAHGEYFKAREC